VQDVAFCLLREIKPKTITLPSSMKNVELLIVSSVAFTKEDSADNVLPYPCGHTSCLACMKQA
jgi:hypothetical protein